LTRNDFPVILRGQLGLSNKAVHVTRSAAVTYWPISVFLQLLQPMSSCRCW